MSRPTRVLDVSLGDDESMISGLDIIYLHL